MATQGFDKKYRLFVFLRQLAYYTGPTARNNRTRDSYQSRLRGCGSAYGIVLRHIV